ncbi:MAG: hypothetical protein B6D37_08760 [Sphingobacteriales bacterium UTBCD1]|nr:MAG: hypothetical protein B6D37_08760 [Sphingobacteriales bacterium UTBCD1]
MIKNIFHYLYPLVKMKEMLNRFRSGSYPQLFGMMFGYPRNNLKLRNVYFATDKGQPNEE